MTQQMQMKAMQRARYGYLSQEMRNGAGEGPGPKGPCQESSKFILGPVESH